MHLATENIIDDSGKQIEQDLPAYLTQFGWTPDPASMFFHSCQVRTTLQFVRTLIARQALIEELDAEIVVSKEEASFATSEACRLSVDTVKIYSRLRHLGLLRLCGFHAVCYISAAAHTLIACMRRNSDLAFEHRPDLLTAIDILHVFSSPFPYAEKVARLLVELSRTLDHSHGSNSQSEAVAIRVLARRMAQSPTRTEPPPSTPGLSGPSRQDGTTSRVDTESLLVQPVVAGQSTAASSYTHSSISETAPPPAHRRDTASFNTSSDNPAWLFLKPTESVDQHWVHNASDGAGWEDGFSFLNDGLFSKL